MGTRENLDSEWYGTRFPRERHTGVILGLDWLQVIYLVVFGIGLSMVLVFALGFPLGVLGAVINLIIAAGIGIPRFWGRSLLMWAYTLLMFLFRGAKGQTRYHRHLPVASTAGDREQWHQDPGSVPGRDKHTRIDPGAGYKLALPGEHAELKAHTLPGGAGFVYDPKRREGIVVARLQTRRAFTLESDESQEDRGRGFRDGITALSGIPGVARVQMSDQTTMVSGSRVKSWYDKKRAEAPPAASADAGEVPLSGEAINPFLHAAYVEHIKDAQDQPVHEMWLTVVLNSHRLERRALAAGGGLRGFMEVALGIMGTVEQIIATSGIKVVGWHTPRSVSALARSAFDPDSALEISDREGDWAGASPESAGPIGADVAPNHLWSDGWYHRTFMISEWPQARADLGFLDDLVFAGEFRHTVTVVFKPKEIRAAMRKTQQRKADWETGDKMRRKLDRPESLEHQREIVDIEAEEMDLMEGHAAIDVVGLVTVSGSDEEQLESHAADIRAKATQANCELRTAALQQDAAFVAAALPFGRAILT